jgi:hypothetical protein
VTPEFAPNAPFTFPGKTLTIALSTNTPSPPRGKGELILIIYIPALCAIIGALVYALSKNAEVKQLAYGLYWTGLLVTLLQVAGKTFGAL